MSKQIFITGGSGYIGSVVIEQAVAQGYSVHALSRTASSDTKLAQLGAVPVRGDLTSLDVLERESAAASAGVVHLAFANAGNYDMPYDEVLRINAAALDAVAAGLRQAPSSPPLIFTCGSLVAAPDPHGGETTEETPYDSNPLNDFHMAEAHALSLLPRPRVCSVRLAPWVYGRGGSGVLLLLNLAASAGPRPLHRRWPDLHVVGPRRGRRAPVPPPAGRTECLGPVQRDNVPLRYYAAACRRRGRPTRPPRCLALR